MAVAIKAINAKIRSNKVLDYLCSTHFWGPMSNFGIPLAAVMDTQKDPEIISGRMTGALTIYSATFMRYSMAVSPANYLLFACHFVNFNSQVVQGYRYYKYWHAGGRETFLEEQAKAGVADAKSQAEGIANKAEQLGADAKIKGEQAVQKVKSKLS